MEYFNCSYKKSLVCIVLLLIASFSCNFVEKKDSVNKRGRTPSRIISLTPSITETLFELELGDKVVGVTNFCIYPPKAKEITKIGGFMDPYYEVMLKLKPELVVLLKEHDRVINFLDQKKIPYIAIDNQTISDILKSIIVIGKACGKEKEARLLRDEIAAKIDSTSCIYDARRQHLRPKVLISVGRGDIGAGNISKIWAAGVSTFYNELIYIAGGINVVSDSLMDYPIFSGEGIIGLMPDIIIDVMTAPGLSIEQIKGDWKKFDMVPAVKNGFIFCLMNDYMTIPGPRVVLILKEFNRIIKEYFVYSGSYLYSMSSED